MADPKDPRPTQDDKIASSPQTTEQVGDMPLKDVEAEDATQAEFYRQFAENGPEWRAAFEKKLKRKVDLRLIPLLVRCFAHFMLPTS